MDDGRNDEGGCVWLLLLNCGDSMGLLLNGDWIGDCILVMLLLVAAILLSNDGCCIIEGCCGWMRNWPDDGDLKGCCCGGWNP